MYSTERKEVCFNCLLQPCLNFAIIFGIEPLIPCNCQVRQPSTYFHKVIKKYYIKTIEILSWEHFVLAILELIPTHIFKCPCESVFSVISIGATEFKIGGLILSFVSSTILTFFKHNKTNVDVKLRHPIFQNEKAFYTINNLSLLISVIVIFLISSMAIVNSFILYPAWRMGATFASEAFICCIEFGIWVSYLIGGIAIFLILAGIIGFVIIKEFQQLSSELALLRRNQNNLQVLLEETIARQDDLWRNVSQMNNKFNYVLVIIHTSVTFGTSFSYYMYLYIDMDKSVKYIMFGLVIISTFVCIIYGFLLCYAAFSIQNTFQDIRGVAASKLSVQFQLKVLDFMKRFGKCSLAISIGGCFNITKNFPLKLAKSLHSVFSSLLKLRDVSYQSRNHDEILTCNNTYS
ncbi:uncharacterized protein LOC111613921 [Centruroides sculpturatus]|uniref:uncharacterized protein LOC111613921 n=1 Tax=Centruroides sculpturatus TaxID=218467 RepID=UPI000C6EA44F|nr:uncharacterized protein LOC111613921 [Centruroides sculpturatus]